MFCSETIVLFPCYLILVEHLRGLCLPNYTIFLEKYNLLSSCQYWFRAGMFTPKAVMNNVQYIYMNLDKGNIVISLVLDFSKACGCIDHSLLFDKLRRYIEWEVYHLTSSNPIYLNVVNICLSVIPIQQPWISLSVRMSFYYFLYL